eukprot:1140333-Pelagomonas_calceolata.AAC.7
MAYTGWKNQHHCCHCLQSVPPTNVKQRPPSTGMLSSEKTPMDFDCCDQHMRCKIHSDGAQAQLFRDRVRLQGYGRFLVAQQQGMLCSHQWCVHRCTAASAAEQRGSCAKCLGIRTPVNNTKCQLYLNTANNTKCQPKKRKTA